MRKVILEKALKLAESHTHLILNWATGAGKSKVAISIASKYQPPKLLLVVAEIAHKSNWEAEFKKWGEDVLWEQTSVECYASLKNHRNTEWDMIILDEGHHAMSELRTEVLSTLKVKRVIVLTATLSTEDEDTLSTVFDTPFVKDTIDLQEAISCGILPTPKIFVLPLLLDCDKETETIKESWGTSSKRVNVIVPFEKRFFYMKKAIWPASNLTIKCTQYQKYTYISEKINYFKRQFMRMKQEYLKNKWMQLGSARKRMLAEFKLSILEELLQKIDGRRYICFCGSIEQAELLGGENAIHSKKANPLKIIEKFNNKEINSLVAVNMLQEGQNLADIEIGIISQLDGQERAFIQKFGRTLRAEDPIQIILYYHNTRDEEYLLNALEEIDSQYVKTVKDIPELLTHIDGFKK